MLNKLIIANAGIYSVTIQAQFMASAVVGCTAALSWVAITDNANLAQVALARAQITASFNLQSFPICEGGAWTGLVSAGATVTQNGMINYTGTANTVYCVGGATTNLMTVTRIA